VYYSLIFSAILLTVIMSIHYFSAILIKKGVLLLIRISVLSLKDSAYITD